MLFRSVAEAIEQADAAVDGGGRRLDIDDADAKAGADAPAAAPTHKHGLPADARPRAEAPDVAALRPNAEATARRVVEPRLGEEGTPGVAPKRLTTLPPPVVLGVGAHEVTPPQMSTPMSQPAVDTSRPAEPIPMADQLVQALRVQWRDGGGEATVTLHPEFLGQVSISLRVEGGGMTAVVRAEESQVRDWIQANIGLLRDRLQEQGLTLHKFEVSDGYQAPNGQPRDERGNGRPVPRSARRQPRTTDTPQAFEVKIGRAHV